MIENQFKEQFSTHFICTLASLNYLRALIPSKDDGADLIFHEIEKNFYLENPRYLIGSKIVLGQVKSTTPRYAFFENGYMNFDLDVKNYNDLIHRRNACINKQSSIPLVLLLVVVPENFSEAVGVLKGLDKFVYQISTFWFYPPSSLGFSQNRRTQRVKIPIENKVNLTFFKDLFNLHFDKYFLHDQ